VTGVIILPSIVDSCREAGEARPREEMRWDTFTKRVANHLIGNEQRTRGR